MIDVLGSIYIRILPTCACSLPAFLAAFNHPTAAHSHSHVATGQVSKRAQQFSESSSECTADLKFALTRATCYVRDDR
jgi:hypothetical protein